MSKIKIVYGYPYIIKRVELDGEVFYEVYRNDSEVKWRYRWIADASTFEAAQRRMLEDYEMQVRLIEARQGGLEV